MKFENQLDQAAAIILSIKEATEMAAEKGGIYMVSSKSYLEDMMLSVTKHCDEVSYQEVEGIFDLTIDDAWKEIVEAEAKKDIETPTKWDSRLISKISIASVVI